MMSRLFGFFLCLLTLLIPFDHRYDKWARHFSLKLIPDHLQIPIWFEKRLYVYPSDLIALILFAIALYSFRASLKKLLLDRGGSWLWAFFLLCLVSILASPLAGYPVIYTRLLQLLTPILLFLAVSQKGESWTTSVLWCLLAGGVFQALLGLYQYFAQEPLGLHLLGELKNLSYAGSIPTFKGARWLLDHWTGTFVSAPELFRASGTFNHSNPLGSFLLVSLFSGFALFSASKGKRLLLAIAIALLIAGLIATFSRSALFGAIFGGALFFYKARPPRSLGFVIAVCTALCLLLFGEQMVLRGGIFNITELSQSSDRLRLAQNRVAFSMIEKHPVLGVGYQQFTYTPEFNRFDEKEAITMVHNTPLLIAAESGLFGLLCIAAFFFTVLRRGFLYSTSAAGAAGLSTIIAFCWIANCDFYPFYFQHAKMSLFLMTGLLMASASPAIEKDLSLSTRV